MEGLNSGLRQHEVLRDLDMIVLAKKSSYFKGWLPIITQKLKVLLEETANKEARERSAQSQREREAEERRLRIMREVKI